MGYTDLELKMKMSADYWYPHAGFDDCPEDADPKAFANLPRMTRGFTKVRLASYLGSSREPLRTIQDGELFDARQFPAGTLIGADGEELKVTGPSDKGEFEYWEGRKIGVVIDGDTKKGLPEHRSLVLFTPLEAGGYYVHVERPDLQLGEVIHHKIRTRKENFDTLTRFNKVTIYEIGKGQAEGASRGLWRPQLRPLPGMT